MIHVVFYNTSHSTRISSRARSKRSCLRYHTHDSDPNSTEANVNLINAQTQTQVDQDEGSEAPAADATMGGNENSEKLSYRQKKKQIQPEVWEKPG